MDIIPAIDLLNGQCVRLSAGDFARQTTYAADPLAMAQRFEQAGIRRLHVVDLDGARAGQPVNLAVLERLARHTNLAIDAGGGIQSDESLAQVLAAGAQHITAGSIAVRAPDTVRGWLKKYGAEVVFIGADFREGRILTGAWAEASGRTVEEFVAAYTFLGATTFIATDVSKDGLLQGPSFAAYRQLRAGVPEARLIASGGITTIADLEALAASDVAGAIIGKALYEGTIDLADLRQFLT